MITAVTPVRPIGTTRQKFLTSSDQTSLNNLGSNRKSYEHAGYVEFHPYKIVVDIHFGV